MMTRSILFIFMLLFLSCGTNLEKAEAPQDTNDQEREREREDPPPREEELSGPSFNFNYSYPENLLGAEDAGFNGNGMPLTDIGFYPIGFSEDGLFAYLERPCGGGCGCCTHTIVIQNIFTDKQVARLDLIVPDSEYGTMETNDHEGDWNRQIRKITKFLRTRGISQVPVTLKRQNKIIRDRHTFEFKYSVKTTPNYNSMYHAPILKYHVQSVMDGGYTVTVSSGKFEEAESFEYIGFVESPYTNQILLIFDMRTVGFERETDFKVFPVGVTLNPELYYR